VLYLAELKKQSRGFIGGSKNELKLLACQHSDQTWSAVPTEETIFWEDSQGQIGEGALLLVNLSNNRQIQGTPEPAGPQLLNQLLKISRLMGKSKEQQEEIEQWKQSLAYQAQELSRREMEMEARLEQIEQMEAEFEYLERQRLELDQVREALAKEQQRLEETRNQVGLSVDLNSEQATIIEDLINRLASSQDNNVTPWQQLTVIINALHHQQTQLSNYQQQIREKQVQLAQQENATQQKQEKIQQNQQQLTSIQTALEQAKIEQQIQNNFVNHKQELLNRIKENLATITSLNVLLTSEFSEEQAVKSQSSLNLNLRELENMPLGELEEKVNKLQVDLDKLVQFVNEQEEELTMQSQTVQELEAKLDTVSELERLTIEAELKDERERKKMLDETLIGQRRTLWERQDILLEHLRVLRRRQGILDPQQQTGGTNVNIVPVLDQLSQQLSQGKEEQQKLETEIETLQTNLRQLEEMIQEYAAQQQKTGQELQKDQEEWENSKITLAQLQSQINLYEETFLPLQDSFNYTYQTLRELGTWFGIQSSDIISDD
jgi:chromosome segregation ATPase